jgi:3-deoxy-D-manno-octulosonic-acid transferase
MREHGRPPEIGGYAGRGRLRLALALVAYDLLLMATMPFVALWLGWRLLVNRKQVGHWGHRFGFVPRARPGGRPRIWVHAVSAGEMGAAQPVVAALREAFPNAVIGVSTHTDTGMAVAKKSCARADALFYLPFDSPDCMWLALRRLRPDLVVVVEKELWPNLLGVARMMGARVLVVNGRVSDRMVQRGRWASGFVRWLYRLPDVLCVQSAGDAKRLRRFGVSQRQVVIAGNTKVDALADRDERAEARLARELGVGQGEVWLVAGSTHPREEEEVVLAFRQIRQELPSARLLLAPRHLERTEAVCEMVRSRGLEVARRSEGGAGRSEPVVLLDTMGELRAGYGFATAGFVGGTLVPVGGHNLLEPVAAARPVLFGPHTDSCADVADLVLREGVGIRVQSGKELAEQFLRIAGNRELRQRVAERARRLIERQRGASERCAEAARAMLRAGGAR